MGVIRIELIHTLGSFPFLLLLSIRTHIYKSINPISQLKNHFTMDLQ